MGFFKCLLLVALLAHDVAAQPSWMGFQKMAPTTTAPGPPPQLPQRANALPELHQSKEPGTQDPVDTCHVEEGEKIQCGLPEITAEQCYAVDCCFDGQQCYYGQTVTLQCTRDGQFVVVVARDATLPRLDVESVMLLEANEASCSPVATTSAFAVYQFPVTDCGTTLTEDGGYVVYNNYMSSSYEVGIGPRGSITRDSHFELMFQCKYSGQSVEALVFDVNSLPPPLPVAALGPLRIELLLGSGQCYHKGCIEAEEAYRSFYTAADYPISKVLRQAVYVQVHISERTDPNIVLNLERCWATADPSATSLPQWDLLVDGCPYHDDRYLTALVPVSESSGLAFPSHYKRFIVKMFTFVEEETLAPRKERVFIHCTTAVCHPSPNNSCQQQCRRKRRSTTGKKVSPNQRAMVSSGEVILSADQALSPRHAGKSKSA
ncbi:unnamed protein product [Gadus morhua 'NCC']